MSKPQVAAEPTLEEILASIRKMISDDKPGPNPMPDQMGRTPFGEALSRSSSLESKSRDAGETSAASRVDAGSTSGFNSLSDALKVATTQSDQRRALQQEVASALDKTPRSNLDVLTEISSARSEAFRATPEIRFTSEPEEQKLPTTSERKAEAVAAPSENKRDLLSFDFGNVVPQRDDQKASPFPDTKTSAPLQGSTVPGVAAAAVDAVVPKAEAKVEAKVEQPAEPRVLHLRSASAAASSLGAGAPNVAPFPRPLREVPKSDDAEPLVPVAKPAETPSKPAEAMSKPAEAANKPAEAASKTEVASTEPQAADAPKVIEPLPAKADALTLHGEALLDAVVDLVQQQPSSLSVFTSGASFISGVVGAAKAAGELKVGEDKPAAALPAPSVSAPEAPQQKIDRDAAELLRPMLRQWLAENMGRILEEALRSELTDQIGKGPAKT